MLLINDYLIIIKNHTKGVLHLLVMHPCIYIKINEIIWVVYIFGLSIIFTYLYFDIIQ